MPALDLNSDPRMTGYLVKTQVFRSHPITLVDVGARGGYLDLWKLFGDQSRIIGFEPDLQECERLNASAARNVTYLPTALGSRHESRKFFTTRYPGASGFFRGDTAFVKRLLLSDCFQTVKETTLELRPLDAVLQEAALSNVDMLKLDCEGSELDVLEGAEGILRDFSTLGVLAEVAFHKDLRAGIPTHADLDRHLTDRGFRLYDIAAFRFSRRAMPFSYTVDLRDEHGAFFPGPSTHGQILIGHALYFRDFLEQGKDEVAPHQLLKMACLFEIFNLNDCAAELIIAAKDTLSELSDVTVLLDLLSPEIAGKRLTYNRYMTQVAENPEVLLPASPRGGTFPQRVLKRLANLILRHDGQPVQISRSAARRVFRKVFGT